MIAPASAIWRGIAPQREIAARLTHIDREGHPYAGRVVTVRGTEGLSIKPKPGEPDLDFDPDYPQLAYYGELEVHVRVHGNAPAPMQELCCFAMELFTPGPADNWLYVLFPKVNGKVISFRNSTGAYVISAFGRTERNPNIGQPLNGFTPDAQATMMTTATFHNPLVPA